jgi:hypothetical protein
VSIRVRGVASVNGAALESETEAKAQPRAWIYPQDYSLTFLPSQETSVGDVGNTAH